jgi:hypothetical protein
MLAQSKGTPSVRCTRITTVAKGHLVCKDQKYKKHKMYINLTEMHIQERVWMSCLNKTRETSEGGITRW